MSIEIKEKKELDITSNENKEVWVTMTAQKVIKNLEFYQSEAIICTWDKDLEEAIQLVEDELEI